MQQKSWNQHNIQVLVRISYYVPIVIILSILAAELMLFGV